MFYLYRLAVQAVPAPFLMRMRVNKGGVSYGAILSAPCNIKRTEQQSEKSRLFIYILDTTQQHDLINSMLKNVVKVAKNYDLM